MGRPTGLGTPAAGFEPDTGRLAEALAEHDDDVMAAFVFDAPGVPLGAALARQTAGGLIHPVYFGSAVTGAGVDALVEGLATVLPAAGGDPDGPVSATVFKVERGPSGEKMAYVRMFSGTLRVRDRLAAGKVTAISVPDGGTAAPAGEVVAGQIGKLWGLRTVRIGDSIGEPRPGAEQLFAPPTLETVVVPRDPRDRPRLHAALVQLAEQDPLIDLRQDHELSVSLYGEVQKEVIEATLATEHGVLADFRESTTIYVERVTGTGEATEILGAPDNPFVATIGLRIEPAPPGSGVAFHLDVPVEAMPMYVYSSASLFHAAMHDYVRSTLRQGLHGWDVTDCLVTMTQSGYSAPSAPPATTAS